MLRNVHPDQSVKLSGTVLGVTDSGGARRCANADHRAGNAQMNSRETCWFHAGACSEPRIGLSILM
jgi:hypothetical protein